MLCLGSRERAQISCLLTVSRCRLFFGICLELAATSSGLQDPAVPVADIVSGLATLAMPNGIPLDANVVSSSGVVGSTSSAGVVDGVDSADTDINAAGVAPVGENGSSPRGKLPSLLEAVSRPGALGGGLQSTPAISSSSSGILSSSVLQQVGELARSARMAAFMVSLIAIG